MQYNIVQVQCLFEHKAQDPADKTKWITSKGYSKHDSPSALCTGASSWGSRRMNVNLGGLAGITLFLFLISSLLGTGLGDDVGNVGNNDSRIFVEAAAIPARKKNKEQIMSTNKINRIANIKQTTLQAEFEKEKKNKENDSDNDEKNAGNRNADKREKKVPSLASLLARTNTIERQNSNKSTIEADAINFDFELDPKNPAAITAEAERTRENTRQKLLLAQQSAKASSKSGSKTGSKSTKKNLGQMLPITLDFDPEVVSDRMSGAHSTAFWRRKGDFQLERQAVMAPEVGEI